MDEEGHATFQLLQNFQRTGEKKLIYYVLNLLRFDGKDLTKLPLLERKARLKKVVSDQLTIRVSDHIETDGKDFFRVMQKQNIEGMLAKDAASLYRQGRRSEEWLKVKTPQRLKVVIAGFTALRGKRLAFGALILEVYENRTFKYIDHTEIGFKQALLKSWCAEPLSKRKRAVAEF